MKLAYGTYAMPTMRLEDAIPLLARIGYDGVELCIASAPFDTMPAQMNKVRRSKLRELLAEHGVGVPALMMIRRSVLSRRDETHQDTLRQVRSAVSLARDLGVQEPPVIAMGFGGSCDRWETQRDQIVSRLQDYARMAEEEEFILAGEAHHGAAVDRTERARWVIDAIDDPHIRLHFDIAHFVLAGESIAETIKWLVPITVHTHVADVRLYPGGDRGQPTKCSGKERSSSFEFCLLGEGDVDLVSYMEAMERNGWDKYITAEISTRVWSGEDYDPHRAALSCYEALTQSMRQAGVTRS